MIVSFANEETQRLAGGYRVKRFVGIERVALRKLRQLQIAMTLNDLRVPPGNHLERLQGEWWGYMSIRINKRWRICFKWTQKGPAEVQIFDYH